MSNAREALDRIKARAAEATPGPWEELKERVVTRDMALVTPRLHRKPNAEFISHARTDVPRLTEALEAVLDEHKPDEDGDCMGCTHYEHPAPVVVNYPCPLVWTITHALTEEDA